MRKALLLLAATAALSACSSAPIDSTESVCDDFAKFIKDGRPADQRSEVVSSIGEVIDNADKKVQDAYSTLTNTVNSNPDATSLADDTFAQSCFDAGWEG